MTLWDTARIATRFLQPRSQALSPAAPRAVEHEFVDSRCGQVPALQLSVEFRSGLPFPPISLRSRTVIPQVLDNLVLVEPAQSEWAQQERLTGYQQVTDAHLLALAERHGGCVATFDRELAALATSTSRVHLLEPEL